MLEKSWRDAITAVLAASPTPLHYGEIADRIIAEGYRTNVGATPATSVNVAIRNSIRNDGSCSPFTCVARGTYALARASEGHSANECAAPRAEPPESAEMEEQYDIITSFGMFWQRNAIEWSATPSLLGMQQIGATPVDFSNQRGIYLLYDNREVVYVGRTTDRALGRRLFEHTKDRLATRWDRFSWFGLLPVSDTGCLGQLPETHDAGKLIPALEAILIEALEPRQNRKRGDDLAAVEYIQHEDPEIVRRRNRAALDALRDQI